MPQEFVMRGKTASGLVETLNFSGYKPGYAYRLTEFQLYPSSSIGANPVELMGTVTAGKNAVSPADPDFNNEGLIGTAYFGVSSSSLYPASAESVIYDTFLITQNLKLMVKDTDGDDAINWQCRFVAEKMNKAEEAVTNYKQFTIFD